MNEALKEPILFEEEHKVVQKNKAYFDMKWGYVEDPARNNSWNWIAFFFFTFWLPYRKMYKPFFTISVLQLFWMIPFFLVDIPQWFHLLFYFVIALVVGRNGNRWYYHYVSNALNQVKSLSVPKQPSYLKIKGGTNIGMMLGTNVFLLLLFFLSYAGLSSLPTETNIKDVVRLSDEAFTLETSMDKHTWKYVEKAGRYHVVEFTGYDYRKNEDVRIAFNVYKDKELFEWHAVYINGKKLTEKDAEDYQLKVEDNS